MVSDHDQSPDGQHQGVPDGHPVQDQSKVGMEQEEDCPAVGVLNRAMIDLLVSQSIQSIHIILCCGNSHRKIYLNFGFSLLNISMKVFFIYKSRYFA